MAFVNPRICVSSLSLKEGMTVADFGSGTGSFTFCASDYVGNTGIVYAIDVQKDLLTTLARDAESNKSSNIHTLCGDLEEDGGSGLGSSMVDAVICSNFLFQVEEKENVIKEAKRVLKTNGKLIIIDWSQSHNGLGPAGDKIFSERDARALAKNNGFLFSEKISAGDYHYGLVFIKKDE